MDMNLRKLWGMEKDREAWLAAVHGVTKSQTQFSNWTTNKNLLYSTGNSTQYSVMTYMGKESGKEWIYVFVLQIRFAVHLKLRQHCKSTILQFKIFVEASSCRHPPSTQSPAPLSFPEGTGRAESAKLLTMVCSFWWPALIQEPTRVTSLEQKTLLSPGKSKEL